MLYWWLIFCTLNDIDPAAMPLFRRISPNKEERLMNSTRGQYTSAPLYNMKNRRPAQQSGQGGPTGPDPNKNSKRFGLLALVLSVALPILFLLSLLIPSNPLRMVFLAAALISVALMWLLNAFSRSARSTLTIVYLALAVVIGLALFMSLQSPEARKASNTVKDPGTLFTDTVDMSVLNNFLQNNTIETPVPDTPAVSAAQQRLEQFLEYWAGNNIPGMLEICTPSWVSQQQSPEGQLWNLMLNRRPVQYVIENAQGSDLDSTRTITLKVTFMKEGSNETTLNRMQVLMFRSNELWYVDPQSLGGTVIDEAAELTKQQALGSFVGSTIAPTFTPAPQDSKEATILYYNADGGKYYHAIANCSAVDEQYWPLSQFYYSDLNSTKFKNLNRCPKCNPPARP